MGIIGHMTQLTLSLLGPFVVSWREEPVTRFPTDKVRALLAYLAMEAERPFWRASLAALLWPDWPEDIARRNLRQNLYRLKQLLDSLDTGLSDRLLTISWQSVQLNREWIKLDVTEFQKRVTAVETHSHRQLHTCQTCLDNLAQAASLTRGDLLAGFSLPDAPLFDEWLTIQRERHHYQTLQILYNLAAAYERRGEYEQAYKYAVQQITLDPWREEAHRQAMRALAQQGQRNQALAQYADCCRLLETELGLSPTAETTNLYEQIRSGSLITDKETAVPAQLHHFPIYFTPFIGREHEQKQIIGHLQDPTYRLLTLIAPGGMGKTRLTVAVAMQLALNNTRWRDGLFFIPLAEATTRKALLAAITKELMVPLQGGVELLPALLTFLADKQMLLVLDNFEQLAAESDLLLDLLTVAPGLQFLVTSREPLNLQAEQRVVLGGLPCPDNNNNLSQPAWTSYAAVQVFLQAATRIRSDFDPEQEQMAINRICQLTQGMPLALEMAAAWVRLMTCQQIADQISANLDFLIAAVHDVPDRHRSIRAVFAQSWQMLAVPEQAVLAQLAVFHGSFSLEAAVYVSNASVLALSILTDKTLIGYGLTGRYEMHTLLRQFALEKLDTLFVEGHHLSFIGRQRHVTYFLQMVARHESAFHGPDAASVLRTLQPDLDNIRQAWQWAVNQKAVSLLIQSRIGICRLLRLQGLHEEGANLMAQAAARLAEEPSQNAQIKQATALLHYEEATLRIELNQYGTAWTLLEAARETWEKAADQHHLATVLAELGIIAWRQGDLETAETRLEASLALAQQTKNKGSIAYALHHLGNIAWFREDYAAALALVDQSLPFYREQGDLRRLAGALSDLGSAYLQYKRNYAKANTCYQESLALYRKLGDRLGMTIPLGNLGYTALLAGDYDTARRLYEEVLTIKRSIGAKGLVANTLNNLGLVALLDQEEIETAVSYFQEGLALSRMVNERQAIGEALAGLMVTAVRKGDIPEAVRLAGSIHKQTLPTLQTGPLESQLYAQALAAARAALDEATFTRLWAEGEQITL